MEVQQRHGEEVHFVGVPGRADEPAMANFVAETGVDAFPHIPDVNGSLWDRFGVHQQHTYVYINDDGTFRLSGYGQLEADVEDLINS